jgi:hypothetical protein
LTAEIRRLTDRKQGGTMPVSPRRLAFIALLLVVLLVSRCSTTYKTDQIDYKSQQTTAAIMLGDPQVFDRASLINDRRREIDYLQQLLQNSTTIAFPPQIVQELRTVEALSTNVGLRFGLSVPANPTTADLSQQIAVAKLQAQLAILQKQTEGIQGAMAPVVTVPAPDVTTPGGSSAATVISPDVTALQTAIKAIQTQLADLTKTTPSVTAPGKDFSAFADPRNDLLARQAYRRDIRAALAEAQLDDVHDRAGDALYRLQFQATVLPRNNDIKQWAAARLSIAPPQLTKDVVTTLYFAWLDYISRVLSTPLRSPARNPASPGHDIAQDRYFSAIQWFQFFDLVDVYAQDVTDRSGNRRTLYACLDHRTASEKQLQELRCDRNAERFEDGSQWGDQSYPCSDGYRFLGTSAIPRNLIEPSPYPISGMPKMCSLAPEEAKLLEKFTRPTSPPTGFDSYVSQGFCKALAVDDGVFCASCPADGAEAPARAGSKDSPMSAVRSYSVLPAELSQRIGLTSESSRSLQNALSLAVQISSSATGSLDSGGLTQADIRTQTVERQPLVVGFASTETDTKGSPHSIFGWLFGPEFVAPKETKLFNPPWFLSWLPRHDSTTATLTLSQQVHNYGVTADIAFPGWWNYVDICVGTAFVSDWSQGTVLNGSSSCNPDPPAGKGRFKKTIRLPLTDASLDALTSFIAAQHIGPESGTAPNLSISYVTPDVVPSCASTVVFQIGGSNIWRAEQAYFGGVPTSIPVEVLPDMKSIAATFDMSKVFGALSSGDSTVQSVPLVVAAKQGESPALPILLVGKRQLTNGATTCQSPILLPTTVTSLPPTVVEVTPHEVCSGTKIIPMVVHGVNLPSDLELIPNFETVCPPDGPTCDRPEPGGCCFWKTRLPDNGNFHRAATLTAKEPLTKGSVVIALANEARGFAYSTTITVSECAPKTAEAKAQLTTTSVKLAKDQKIELKMKVPERYAEIVVEVRPKGSSDDWTVSSPVTPKPGDAVEIKATIDLSKVNAKADDKLEVRVRMRSRPNAEPEAIAADKTLDIDAS